MMFSRNTGILHTIFSTLRTTAKSGERFKLFALRLGIHDILYSDNALQIHGGNGYAEEYIFEGAAEIQAQVIARGLLSGRN